MFFLNSTTSSVPLTSALSQIDFDLFFTFINTVIAAFSAWFAYKANQSKDETAEIKNTINNQIDNYVKVSVAATLKNEIENEIEIAIKNNVSAEAVASVVFNDENKIKEISSAVATALIEAKTPKLTLSGSTLNIELPGTGHSFNAERK